MQSMYQKKCCEDKHVDWLLIGNGQKKHYVVIKDFNTFTYHHTLHYGRKHLCPYCLLAVRAAGKLKCHIKDYFKINGKKTINMPKKGEYNKFDNFGRKIKSTFMFMQILKVFQYLKIMEGKVQMSLILTNIKNMLLVVMVIN